MLLLPYIPLWFMALGVGLMTPVRRPIADALIGGLSADSVVKHPEVLQAFPEVRLIRFEEAASNALSNLSPKTIERVWDDGRGKAKSLKHEGCFIDHREIRVNASPEKVFAETKKFGMNDDWFYANWLWHLRGWIDSRVRNPAPNRKSLDANFSFYRVDAIEENRILLLRSQLKTPGEGWLEWRVEPDDGGTRLTQTSFFAPRGLPGFLYWYLLYPFHHLVLRGLIRAIAHKSVVKSQHQ